MLGEWWKPHCNVYVLNHRLVSARRRRSRIQTAIDKRALWFQKTETADLSNKFPLSVSSFFKKEEEPERKKLETKKPEQGKTKTIIAHQ